MGSTSFTRGFAPIRTTATDRLSILVRMQLRFHVPSTRAAPTVTGPARIRPLRPQAASAPPLVLQVGTVLKVVLGIAAVLLAFHLVVVWSYLGDWRFPARDKFYLDAENNLPTVFSTLILLLATSLLAWISRIQRHARDPFARHWIGLAIVFLALTVDESASFHELLIHPLRTAYGTTGWLRFPWVVAGGAFVVVFASAYLRFLAHLPKATRWTFLAAGTLYVGGAVGMEMVGGRVFMEEGTPGRTLVPYMIAMTVEECAEIAGVTLFILGLLRYLADRSGRLQLEVR